VLVAAIGVLALSASSAHGAGIALNGPPHGAVIPTTSASTSVTLSWTADATGCTTDLLSAVPKISGPIPVVGKAVTGAPPSGANMLTFINSRPKRTYTWYVSMDCTGVGEVRSEARTFTIQGANPWPRLSGKHQVVWGSTPQTWRFVPRCKRGACTTRVKIPGVPWFALKFNRKKRVYSARVAGRKGSRAAICTDQKTNKQFRNAYRGWFRLTLRVKSTRVKGVHTLAEQLVGRLNGKYRPTKRGKRLRCPAFRANDPVRTTMR
jgi:hypothetical protein